MSQLPPPPSALSEWVQLLFIQLAAVVALLIGAWKWLTKPLRESNKKIDERLTASNKKTGRRLILLKRAFRNDSFEIRTEATNIMGTAVKNARDIETIQATLQRMEQGFGDELQEIKAVGRENHNDLVVIKERLAAIETAITPNRRENIRREIDQ